MLKIFPKPIIKRKCFSTNDIISKPVERQIKLVKADIQKPEDKLTHTGEKWGKDDYRMVRFELEGPKQVVSKWAIDCIASVPPKVVPNRVIWCDGGDAPLGHPKVFINLDKDQNGVCGYCGLRFYKDRHHH